MTSRSTAFFTSGFGLVSLFFLALAHGGEVRLPEEAKKGEFWLALEMELKEANGGGHSGWDLYGGEQKLLWMGAGWSAQSGKWGVWTPDGRVSEFSRKIEPGKVQNMTLRIRFGETAAGDDAVELWFGGAKARPADVHLKGLNLSGADRLVSYEKVRGAYRLSAPRVGKSLAALALAGPKPTPEQERAPAKMEGAGRVEGEQFYVEKIRPLLASKCGGCHGEDAEKIKGGFDMRSLAGIMAGGDSELAGLVPGKPEESPLFLSVTWEDPDFRCHRHKPSSPSTSYWNTCSTALTTANAWPSTGSTLPATLTAMASPAMRNGPRPIATEVTSSRASTPTSLSIALSGN